MLKSILPVWILWITAHSLLGQSPAGFDWVLPLQNNLIPIGKGSDVYVPLKGNKVVLLDAHQNQKSLPYDSIKYEHHAFWTIWQNGLKGVYHETKGEILPPVFEKVISSLKTENNWAFLVSKYGMNAVVNDRNELLLPYQKYSYGQFTFINDTILGYSKMGNSNAAIDQLAYVSLHGKEITLPVARPFFPADFQRVSANAYVLTQYHQGVPYTDTFPEAGKFINDLAVVRRDSLWGYLQRNGKWLIEPKFQSATSFEKGRYAIVKSKGKFGAINIKGEFVVPPQYDIIKVSVPGYFEFKEGGNIGLLDSTGHVVIKPGAYSKFSVTGLKCVAAHTGDSLFIYQQDGSLITNNKISDCKSNRYNENFLCQQETGSKATKDKKRLWGLMSPAGKWIIEPVISGSVYDTKNFILVETKSDPCCQIGGLQYQQSRNNQYFIFNWQGEPFLNFPVVASNTLAEEEFIIFDRANQFGLLAYNRLVIDPVYDEITALGNGWIKTRQGEKWGILKWKSF